MMRGKNENKKSLCFAQDILENPVEHWGFWSLLLHSTALNPRPGDLKFIPIHHDICTTQFSTDWWKRKKFGIQALFLKESLLFPETVSSGFQCKVRSVSCLPDPSNLPLVISFEALTTIKFISPSFSLPLSILCKVIDHFGFKTGPHTLLFFIKFGVFHWKSHGLITDEAKRSLAVD